VERTLPGEPAQSSAPRWSWVGRTVVGIILVTFFSDFSHEMCTAVLPLYLATVGLGPASLGIIEGFADLLVSLSKLGGGVVGHHVRRKRPLAALGYLLTTLATGAMGLVSSLAALASLRSVAWVGLGRSGTIFWLMPSNRRATVAPTVWNGPATCSGPWRALWPPR